MQYNDEDIGELIHELLDHVEDLTSHIEQIEAENAAMAEALGVHQDDDDGSDDEDEAADAPVLAERGARSGPHDYSAIDALEFARPEAEHNFNADGRRLSPVGAAMRTTEFSEKVRALELTGLSKEVAYCRAAKDLAREVYRPLNL